MIHERYRDRVKIAVIFDHKRIVLRVMKWENTLYRITRVLNVHSTFDGRERVHFFSVATETEFFRLEFHSEDLQWYLVEHYQE